MYNNCVESVLNPQCSIIILMYMSVFIYFVLGFMWFLSWLYENLNNGNGKNV